MIYTVGHILALFKWFVQGILQKKQNIPLFQQFFSYLNEQMFTLSAELRNVPDCIHRKVILKKESKCDHIYQVMFQFFIYLLLIFIINFVMHDKQCRDNRQSCHGSGLLCYCELQFISPHLMSFFKINNKKKQQQKKNKERERKRKR